MRRVAHAALVGVQWAATGAGIVCALPVVACVGLWMLADDLLESLDYESRR